MADIKNEFAFSWSRHQAFYACPRRFYWQHYGSWQGWLDDAPRDAQLAYRLKQLKSVSMLVGETFHAELSEVLRRRPDRPCGVPAEQLRETMERRLLKHLRESRDRDWERFGSVKQYAILFEDYYGPGLSDHDERRALDALRECVQGFSLSGFGRRAFGIDKRRLRLIDPQGFEDKRAVLDGLLVYASPDLLAEDEQGALHIVDWKTGHPQKTSLAQLSIYGLVVSEKHRSPLDRMTAHLVYVRAGVHEPYNNLPAGVDEARRNISTFVKDVHERLTDAEANLADDISAFPMTSDTWKCRSCNFRELCGRTGDPALAPDEEIAG
jgi:CRISPR/Cas system-associated exonuclease Cas4 (RecB family)